MLVLEINDIKQILQKVGYESFYKELIDSLEEDFLNWETFDKSARMANHVNGGVIELMPICNDELYSFKYVNGHPKNPKTNKLTVMATGQLSLVKTGEPLLFSEMTLLTALRTSATSVLAAKYLANSTSSILGFIGTGAQSEFQYLAFSYSFNIKTIRYFDVDKEAMQKFEKNMKSFDVELIECSSASEVVNGSDIVTTMTADKQNQTILHKQMIKKDIFINAIGGDCPGKTELAKDLLKNAIVVVEYLAQSKIEGEIQQLKSYENCFELQEVISKEKRINVASHGTVIFDSVGFALEDFSILRLVYDLALEYNIGTNMNIIPKMRDVKDLYSIVGEL